MSTLLTDLRAGETLVIGGTRVRLEAKSGKIARLVIESDLAVTKIPCAEGTDVENAENFRFGVVENSYRFG